MNTGRDMLKKHEMGTSIDQNPFDSLDWILSIGERYFDNENSIVSLIWGETPIIASSRARKSKVDFSRLRDPNTGLHCRLVSTEVYDSFIEGGRIPDDITYPEFVSRLFTESVGRSLLTITYSVKEEKFIAVYTSFNAPFQIWTAKGVRSDVGLYVEEPFECSEDSKILEEVGDEILYIHIGNDNNYQA